MRTPLGLFGKPTSIVVCHSQNSTHKRTPSDVIIRLIVHQLSTMCSAGAQWPKVEVISGRVMQGLHWT